MKIFVKEQFLLTICKLPKCVTSIIIKYSSRLLEIFMALSYDIVTPQIHDNILYPQGIEDKVKGLKNILKKIGKVKLLECLEYNYAKDKEELFTDKWWDLWPDDTMYMGLDLSEENDEDLAIELKDYLHLFQYPHISLTFPWYDFIDKKLNTLFDMSRVEECSIVEKQVIKLIEANPKIYTHQLPHVKYKFYLNKWCK